jgi:hypothetical protein
MPLQIRRGTNTERENMTVPLAPGEPLYTTDQGFLYIGNGTTLGGVQVTGYQDENAVDAVGAALVAGQNQNITFIYGQTQDVNDRIDAVLDLSVYSGEISADSFRGSLIAENSTLLIDADNAFINLDGTIKGNLIPDQNEVYDIGSLTNRFKDLYLSGNSLWLGDAQLTSIGSAVDLPLGSTIGGSPIGVPGGDLNVNIIGDDSTVIVNTSNKSVSASGGFFGNLTGNLTGNVTGNLTGDVTGNLTGDVKGSIFADDSTILVDATNGNLVGTFIGNVITNSISSADSSEISVLTSFRGLSNIIAENKFIGNLVGDVIGNIRDSSNEIVFNPQNKQIRINELILEGASLISGSPVFFGPTTAFITTVDGTEPIPTMVVGAFLDSAEFGPTVSISKSRGSPLFNTILQSGDQIGQVQFNGFNGSGEFLPGVSIRAIVNAVPTGGIGSFLPGKLNFDIADETNNEITSLSISYQKVDFEVPPKLPIVANDAARSALVPSAEQGMMIFMQSGTTPAATNQVQVFDGTNWVNMS